MPLPFTYAWPTPHSPWSPHALLGCRRLQQYQVRPVLPSPPPSRLYFVRQSPCGERPCVHLPGPWSFSSRPWFWVRTGRGLHHQRLNPKRRHELTSDREGNSVNLPTGHSPRNWSIPLVLAPRKQRQPGERQPIYAITRLPGRQDWRTTRALRMLHMIRWTPSRTYSRTRDMWRKKPFENSMGPESHRPGKACR